MRSLGEKIFGVLLILITIAIAVFLIPKLLPFIKSTPYLLLEPDTYLRHKLRIDWFVQIAGWALAIFTFLNGKTFLGYGKKSS